jgi:hypothetical protein
LETLRPTISGAGNLARFDAWLNHYRTGRTMCELGCARGALDAAVKRIEQARNPEARLATATGALVVRERMSRLWEDMITTQIAATHTPGEIGVIAGLERTARQTARGPDKYYLTCHDQKLAEALGAPLPAALALRTTYTGAARIIVPTTRSQVSPGEAMTLTVHLLAPKGFTGGTLHWRPLGGPAFTDIPLRHVGRAVYDVQLPAATQDIEYYLEATTTAGERLVWPATAPELNQTVIIW